MGITREHGGGSAIAAEASGESDAAGGSTSTVERRTGARHKPFFVANLLGAGLAAVAGVAVTWLVARGLGPVAAGAFFAATSAFVLVGGVARLGTVTALVYWPARLRAQGKHELIGSVLRAGLIPVAVLGTLLGIAVWFAAPMVTPRYAGPLQTLALFLPIVALGDALLAASRGLRLMRPTVLLDKIVRPGGQLLGALALAMLTVPAAGWALAWVLPYVPVTIVAAIIVWRATPSVQGPSMQREFWRYTAPRAVANTAQTALQRLDVLLVAALAGLAPAAAYAVAGRFVVVGQLASGAIGQVAQPRLAEFLSVGDRASAGRMYQMVTGWLVVLCWPLYLTVYIHADLYLKIFGPSYVSAVPVVRIMAAAMLVASGCGLVDMMLAMGGRTTWNLANVLLALTIMITIDLWAIPQFGAVGAALGLAAAVVINNLLPLVQLAVALRLHPFGPATRLAMILSAVSFGVIPWLLDSPFALILGCAVYAASLYFAREKLMLRKVFHAR